MDSLANSPGSSVEVRQPVPVKLSAVLPSRVVPAFITYRGKKWRMVFHGEYKCKRMHSGWGKFVIDNKLKVGDACVFELLECSSQKITFRAQILRGDSPPEFSHWMTGESAEAPVVIQQT
uniref:TF-B3 domain-containing protein n=1 Tax=Rhizophora mucronata TaxID=61149 RepID=A0A2P2JG75_RHIMU